MWTETPRLANGKKGRPVNKDRFISKMSVHANHVPNIPKNWRLTSIQVPPW